jgi:hypothetical protein
VILLIVAVIVIVLFGCFIWPLAWKQRKESTVQTLRNQELVEQATRRLPNLPWYEAAWQPEYLADTLHIEVSEAQKIVNYWVRRGWVARRRQKTHRGREVFYFTNPAGGVRFGRPLKEEAAFYDYKRIG